MPIDFARGAGLMKALSDETRVRIVHILSCGEVCACDLLEHFEISQPTLSHHLGLLVDAGLVAARPEGKWVHYRLEREAFDFIAAFIPAISRGDEKCLCKKTRRTCT